MVCAKQQAALGQPAGRIRLSRELMVRLARALEQAHQQAPAGRLSQEEVVPNAEAKFKEKHAGDEAAAGQAGRPWCRQAGELGNLRDFGAVQSALCSPTGLNNNALRARATNYNNHNDPVHP